MLSEEKAIYTIDEIKQRDIAPMYEPEVLKELSLLNITDMLCSPLYTIFVSCKDIPELKFWSTENLIEKLAVGMFDKLVNIIKYSKITGDDIDKADDAYITNTLGVTLPNEKTKLFANIEKLKESTKVINIYGVGNNTHGQLGTKNISNIGFANKINQPEYENENEYIDLIYPGTSCLIIVTNLRNTYMLGNINKSDNKAPEWKKIQFNVNSDCSEIPAIIF